MAILAKLGAGIGYLCIATVLAAAILIGFGLSSGKLSGAKLVQLRAVLQDNSTPRGEIAALSLDAEQPSYDDILEKRAIDLRQIELREEIVRQNVNLVQSERAEMTAERQAFDNRKKAFDEQLLAMQNTAVVEGEENVRQTIEGIKALQAKDQIMRMLASGEMENVVSLLAAMPMNKRAKIVAEFKTPDESAKLAEILKLMGQGAPVAPVIEDALRPLNADSPTQR